ncbi:cytoplasmic dynein with WD40 domain [Rhizophlyctis rosea]|uniref:Cytoplasmic dynein with WD40 domain n=1 Tax=Rhizophlyctis rosea TaxID=64517 RepID=A0AAD5SJ66_9FUNG|nr:cytoplasmic dynein with WD40 domain [Rhizophlyctis rosea]
MKSVRRPKVVPEPTLGNRTLSTHSLRSNPGDENGGPGGGGGDDWLPPKVLLKPPGQLTLTEQELEEEFTRILNANNPHAPQNIARYSHKEQVFKASPNMDHLIVHYEFDGYLIYKNTEDTTPAPISTNAEGEPTEGGEAPTEPAAASEAGAGGEGTPPKPESAPSGEGAADVVVEEGRKPKGPLRNQFNFSERASQTVNNPYRERWTNTEPPPQRILSDTVNQWAIFDAYMEDQQQKEKAVKEKAKAPPANTKLQRDDAHSTLPIDRDAHSDDVYYKNPELRKALTIMERMANQNTYDEVAQDYKYWEDAADELGDRKSGTLLPLWRFTHDKDKRKMVTSLGWNPHFPDLFAVGYGSYDFSKQGAGMIACFTLKNSSFPEVLYSTEAGVMCLEFHPQHPSMIAVGLYNGTVLVFDIRKKIDTPVFRSSSKAGKHTDPVWQVAWQKDDLDDNPNFFSISSDGRVTQWTLTKTELMYTDVLKLRYDMDPNLASQHGPESKKLFGLAGGCCFDFNKKTEPLFVVGTEEGRIHKCSKEYNSLYLLSFEGHQMSVYTVRYNSFLPNVFLSASADWTVKLWDHDNPKAIMTFDLGSSVGDVAWAPYSSTVFAAVTADGKVFVFDLNENKYDPVCEQPVVRKARLTHVSFNPFEPILLVGDDRGNVISMKLSPNLRKKGGKGGDEDEEPHFSLITGRLKQTRIFDVGSKKGEDDAGDGDVSDTAITLRSSNNALARFDASSPAAQYLAERRTFRGLERKEGETEVQKAEEGRSGVARGYSGEDGKDLQTA